MKEKDQLDFLLCDILLQNGYIADNKPKTGTRQYGVDIQAHKKDELLLVVVKQGNIDRNTWEGNQNAVRQSLDEIADFYTLLLTEKEKKKRLHIVVATNGVIEETVIPLWKGYISQHTVCNGKRINIEFWGIDEITAQAEEVLFNEYLFPVESQSLLRKALYFVEERDYKTQYYEGIIDSYIDSMSQEKGKRYSKIAASFLLASQMIAQYAADAKKYKISVMVTEYAIIKYWKLILQGKQFKREKPLYWLRRLCEKYEHWNNMYYDNVREICITEDAFPYYSNVVEQKTMIYEVLGFLASYGYYLVNRSEDKASAISITDTIIQLINNCPQFYYPPFDDNISELSLFLNLLKVCRRQEDLSAVVNGICMHLQGWYLKFKKYPVPEVDKMIAARNAMLMEQGVYNGQYVSSGLWGYLLLWIAELNDSDLFQVVNEFFKSDLGNVTRCVWLLRSKDEELFYDRHTMQNAGEGINLSHIKDFEELTHIYKAWIKQIKQEKYSFEQYGFPALEMIVCRYYGYVPRICFDMQR